MVDVIKEALDIHVHYKIELLQIYHFIAFHRWNDPYGDYGIYVEIYRKVRVLCSLFQDVMEEELGGSLWDGITDSQVRLYVYFG